MLEQLFRFGAGQAIQNQINIGSGADASSVLGLAVTVAEVVLAVIAGNTVVSGASSRR
eukprot:COSAG01_NODE_11889_length_1840_cov_3.855256_2_plen_58_part_00